MTRAFLAIAVFVTAVALVAANWAVGRAASNSVPRQTIRAINTAGPVIDLLAVGNSLVQAGFDPAAAESEYRRAGESGVAVNAGLGSTSSIEHLALTRLALSRHKVRQVVYGFSDQHMAPEVPLKNSNLIGNYAMLYYLEPELTLKYGGFDQLDRLEFEIYRCCALLRERSNIWSKVEKLRRAMQDQGMPPQKTNQFGRVADMNLLEAADTAEFVDHCERVMRSGNYIAPPIQELIRQAVAYGARVTVVEMPMSPSHLARFYDQPIWQEYRQQNRLAVERLGGVYINASRWLDEETYFEDHLHMEERGAALFSRRLAVELLEHNKQRAALMR